ncbi:MAG: hypothetical protein NT013_18725 [Planctomycetia bacterium]|nr:hypothetical protein [Planctomycetia bacterium]
MADFLPIIVTVLVIAGAIAALTVFFTFWTPVNHFINERGSVKLQDIQFDELKQKPVKIRMKSGIVLEGVVIIGWCSLWVSPPYDMRQLLVVRLPDGRRIFIRATELESFEE